MKVVFCGGGTGGHVYPALTVANALRHLFEASDAGPPSGADIGPRASSPTSNVGQTSASAASSSHPELVQGRSPGATSVASRPASRRSQALDLLYVGVRGKNDGDLVRRENIPFEAITAGPLRAPAILGTARGMLKLLQGTVESYLLLVRFKPDVVFATGGYGSVGVGLAARLQRLPLLLFEPGPEAGLAVKLLARVADRIAVTIPPAYEAMPKAKTSMFGYPVRTAFYNANRDDARRHFGLDASVPVLLVSGASSGANRLNQAIAGRLAEYLRLTQLIHLCGPNDEAWLQSERAKLPAELQHRYHLHAYLHDDMALALAAADLAVMRSGASVLGELPATRLPAILVPGEYEGWDQSNNARYLESEGAAVMLSQSRLDQLYSTVASLLADTAGLTAMREALQGLARPDAASQIAQLIVKMAKAGAPS